MKSKMKVRRRIARSIVYMTFVMIAGLALSLVIEMKLIRIDQTGTLWKYYIIAVVFCILVFSCVIGYMHMARNLYRFHIDLEMKTCRKDKEAVRYDKVIISQSFSQRLLGTCTLIFYNHGNKVFKMKDVSYDVVSYIVRYNEGK